MKSSTFVALAFVSCVAVQGQEIEEGTWSGTRIRMNRNNPQTQKVSLEIKKGPDPHSSWRPGKSSLLNAVFITPQGKFQVSDLRVEQEFVSFSYRQEVPWTCRLDRQTDGSYEGKCVAPETASAFRLTLLTPKGSY